jgi:predicted RecB family endonuclease
LQSNAFEWLGEVVRELPPRVDELEDNHICPPSTKSRMK